MVFSKCSSSTSVFQLQTASLSLEDHIFDTNNSWVYVRLHDRVYIELFFEIVSYSL